MEKKRAVALTSWEPVNFVRSGSALLLVLIAVMLFAVQPGLAGTTNAPALPPAETGGFAPGLLLMVLAMIVACLFLVGFGAVVCMVICALTGALAALGILSSSVAIAFLRRSPASGFRALFIQIGAAAGIPCGVGAMWLVTWLIDAQWSTTARLVVGGGCGLGCGVVVALLFNLAWSRLARWLLGKYENRGGQAPRSR